MSSIASRYHVILYNQAFSPVARFDSWKELSYSKSVNSVGSHRLSILGEDSRTSLFQVDGIIEIYRSIPGLGIDWYLDYQGFHRFESTEIAENSEETFISMGPSLLDLLARTEINYPAATTKSYKLGIAETVAKEYVEENCGSSATVANGRFSDGVLPYFVTDPSTGFGDPWEGDRAGENLLDVVKDICKLSNIDFRILWYKSHNLFFFHTYPRQIGLDRTITGVNFTTGLNTYGNVPTVFSMKLGNIKSISRTLDRMSETNVCSVLGEGDGATRKVIVRTAGSSTDSPWNRREVSRPKTGYDSEMEFFGDEVLDELSAKEVVNFVPMIQERCMYGVHFNEGDRVTVLFKGQEYSKRIIQVNVRCDALEAVEAIVSDVEKI